MLVRQALSDTADPGPCRANRWSLPAATGCRAAVTDERLDRPGRHALLSRLTETTVIGLDLRARRHSPPAEPESVHERRRGEDCDSGGHPLPETGKRSPRA